MNLCQTWVPCSYNANDKTITQMKEKRIQKVRKTEREKNTERLERQKERKNKHQRKTILRQL